MNVLKIKGTYYPCPSVYALGGLNTRFDPPDFTLVTKAGKETIRLTDKEGQRGMSVNDHNDLCIQFGWDPEVRAFANRLLVRIPALLSWRKSRDAVIFHFDGVLQPLILPYREDETDVMEADVNAFTAVVEAYNPS